MAEEKMEFNEAKEILKDIFCAYYGPGYTWRNLIEDMCRRHRRGEEGLSGQAESSKKAFQAAFRLKQEMSDPKSEFGKKSNFYRRTSERMFR